MHPASTVPLASLIEDGIEAGVLGNLQAGKCAVHRRRQAIAHHLLCSVRRVQRLCRHSGSHTGGEWYTLGGFCTSCCSRAVANDATGLAYASAMDALQRLDAEGRAITQSSATRGDPHHYRATERLVCTLRRFRAHASLLRELDACRARAICCAKRGCGQCNDSKCRPNKIGTQYVVLQQDVSSAAAKCVVAVANVRDISTEDRRALLHSLLALIGFSTGAKTNPARSACGSLTEAEVQKAKRVSRASEVSTT